MTLLPKIQLLLAFLDFYIKPLMPCIRAPLGKFTLFAEEMVAQTTYKKKISDLFATHAATKLDSLIRTITEEDCYRKQIRH